MARFINVNDQTDLAAGEKRARRHDVFTFLWFLAALGAYVVHGFDGELTRDSSFYVYAGQEVAAGAAPYVELMNRAGPLAHLLPALGVLLANAVDIADVYGSTWITSGAGSVILLNGNPGDAVVRFHHVKQPVEELGPWMLLHEQETGSMSVHGQVDIVAAAARSGGLIVKDAARMLFETDKPDRNQIEKARRRLAALVRDGRLMATEPGKPSPTTYVAVAHRGVAS